MPACAGMTASLGCGSSRMERVQQGNAESAASQRCATLHCHSGRASRTQSGEREPKSSNRRSPLACSIRPCWQRSVLDACLRRHASELSRCRGGRWRTGLYRQNRKSAVSPASRARCLRLAPKGPRWADLSGATGGGRCDISRGFTTLLDCRSSASGEIAITGPLFPLAAEITNNHRWLSPRDTSESDRPPMKRREVITLLGGAAVASTLLPQLAARAQERERMRRIGVLMNTLSDEPKRSPGLRHSCKVCRRRGGQSAATCGSTPGGPAGDAARVRRYAAELIGLNPDVVLAGTGGTLTPLQQASRTVPIVFAQAIDPVGAGNIETLARPNSNATGFLQFEYCLAGKWLELLKEIAPGRQARRRSCAIPAPKLAPASGPSSRRRRSRSASS